MPDVGVVCCVKHPVRTWKSPTIIYWRGDEDTLRDTLIELEFLCLIQVSIPTQTS